MSGSSPRPPRLARALLGWAARRLDAPELAEDAGELFGEIARRDGERAARAWYRRQARAAVVRAVVPERDADPPRGAGPLGALSLDARLGARMLVKHPGVTIVGGLAMTIGIALAAAYLEVVGDYLHPRLPFPEAERIVGLRSWDLEANDPEPRSAHDFLAWREQLASVEELGAFRTIERNVAIGDAPAEPAQGAEISAAAFRITGVPPLLGRTLIDADEADGAPPVVVLGYDLWRGRFAADAGIVGRPIRVGATTSTVVGVMPAGFQFPLSHRFWMPLRTAPLRALAPREGPSLLMFGRLAPGLELAEARAELAALGARAAAASPDTHARLTPQIMPYTELFVSGSGQAHLPQLFFVTLLFLLGSNVATMIFARTATRENEIAMRYALGASRGQILMQFFVEALVLALAAAAVALAAVAWGTDWLTRFAWRVTETRVPFWLATGTGLGARTIAYALLLAVAAAVVAGVLPALKVTRAGLRARLRHAAGSGADALRFGGWWGGLVVVQVALAVLVLPPAIVSVGELATGEQTDPGFAGAEYLSARVEMESDRPLADSASAAALFAAFRESTEELRRRLLAEPGVSRVTFATRLPGMDHPQPTIEVDSASAAGEIVMVATVEPGFFAAYDREVAAGRVFEGASPDGPRSREVVVNDHFVRELLGGRSAIGRRLRYRSGSGERIATGMPRAAGEPGEWYEIVGVVEGLGMDTGKDAFFPGFGPGVYHPLTRETMRAGDGYAVRLAFHVGGDAGSFGPRLRELAHAADPALRLYDVLPLDGPVDRVNQGQRLVARVFTWGTALVALVALVISMAGTYSVLAFTVARQTREIGIRIALGADRRRIVTGVFSRAMTQIAIGILVGAALWFYALVYRLGQADEIGLLVVSAAALLLVGLVACAVPVRRALRIEPTEALREVG